MAQAVTASPAETPMDQMNITPLIDVLLVLLILFIITIPIQTHAVKVDVPASAGPSRAPDPVRNRVTIDATGIIRWNGMAVDQATLRTTLDRASRMVPEPVLELKPDPQARYVVVDAVLADIKRSGATKLGFIGNEAYARF